MVLVDSDERKVGFLRNMAAKLGLSNVVVNHGRVESLVWSEPEPRIAVCRGFASIKRTLELSGGAFATVIHMKGPKAHEEIAEAEVDFGENWKFETIGEYVLPETQLKSDETKAKRVIVLTKRI
jgi:16S rRNA G527 N7-methylase RsmG